MIDTHNNIDDYNPGKNRKPLIVFDDMIVDMSSNEKLHLVFITKFHFSVRKYFRLNTLQFFIMKVPNRLELQQIAHN